MPLTRGLNDPPPLVYCPHEWCGKVMTLQGPARITPGSVPWVEYDCDAYTYPDGEWRAGCATVERAVYCEGAGNDIEQKWRWQSRRGEPKEVEHQ